MASTNDTVTLCPKPWLLNTNGRIKAILYNVCLMYRLGADTSSSNYLSIMLPRWKHRLSGLAKHTLVWPGFGWFFIAKCLH